MAANAVVAAGTVWPWMAEWVKSWSIASNSEGDLVEVGLGKEFGSLVAEGEGICQGLLKTMRSLSTVPRAEA